ncbi:DUF5594 family protein [Trinickia caryophylli]|nr:DUF5594 family protein [Trinickia caryophylli]PMS10173.1 hypothetical protein C0Z17_21195 [Trinickia caryophylli]TRX18186.1 hypothetical protein FNF07_08125 [Trinickia caryophylli]WQE11025.1 DUF5594 family protein [Trinickia caryophylli]GLU35356.1 hypothetical protein Busp01_51980 [Trinickia caryophylli]
MNPETAKRFEAECVPRIVAALQHYFGETTRASVTSYDGPNRPTTIMLRAAPQGHQRPYSYPLELHFTWDPCEIETLMRPDGGARFAHYLEALPRKLRAWESARGIDARSRTQAAPSILLGSLDFEG